jgi:NADH dehydrogenase
MMRDDILIHIYSTHKVLILGGSGFVGRHVCERLNQLGFKMTVLTRRASHASHIKHLPMVDVVEGDPFKPETLKRVMKGHTAVINLIAILHGSEHDFEKVHERLPVLIANSCAELNVKKLVHISALGADLSAPSEYLRSKARGEQALHNVAHAKSLDLTLLRPSVIFGTDDQFINVFARLQKIFPLIPLASAQAQFQPVWVVDVARAIANTLRQARTRGKTYELVGPQVFSLKQLVKFAGMWINRPKPVIPLPPFISYLQALVMEHIPGPTIMSRDNLLSMRVPNVASGKFPGLDKLGIDRPSSLADIFGISDTSHHS